MINQTFLAITAEAAEELSTDISATSILATVATICAILFGLVGAVFTILYFGERRKARIKAEGVSEGLVDSRLDVLTSGQSMILDNVKEIRDGQAKNHLETCTTIVSLKKDVEATKTDIDRLGKKVTKIEDHIWGDNARGQFDQSDAPAEHTTKGTKPQKLKKGG